MNIKYLAAIGCVSMMALPACYASSDPLPGAKPAAESSSSTPAPDAPASHNLAVSPGVDAAGGGQIGPLKTGVAPFGAIGVAVKIGIAGIGGDIAVPVTSKLNLRVGGSFFSYNPNLVEDGINIVGNIQLQSVSEAFDFFPFGNSFRISPGVVFYNGNHITANAVVPAGSTFTLNSVDYISSPTTPVSGTFDVAFGHQLAPSLTMGFGNMIPRKGGHWSFPVEIGAEYIGKTPRISLNLAGVACQGSTAPSNCQSIASDPTTQQNLAQEQQSLNSDIPTQLRFFPVISFGVSYAFHISHRQ